MFRRNLWFGGVEKILSGVFLLFCAFFLFQATNHLSFGSLSGPKSGFLPILTGATATILALINFIAVLRKESKEESFSIYWKKFGMFFAGLVLYIFLLKIIGYAIATFIALLFLLKVTGTKGWVIPVVISGGFAYGFYFIFGNIFGIPLP